MDPITTVSAAAIIVPVVIIIATVVALKIWKAIRPIVGWIIIFFAVFQFIGLKMTLILGLAGAGWIFQSGSMGDGWMIVLGWFLWFLGFLMLLSYILAWESRYQS